MSDVNSARQPGLATGLSLLIPMTLSTMAIVLLAPILPLLQEEFKDVPNSEYWVPIILTLPALCVAIFSPFAGMLGDYYGRRKLLIWSLAVYGVVGFLPVFLTDIKLILISRVGVGITEALIMTLTTTMIADYFTGEKRNKWLAAQTATASISALIFFNLGGFLGRISWQAPFWVYTSAFIMLAAVLAFTWESSDKEDDNHETHHLHNSSWSGFPWARMSGIILVTIFGSTLFYTVQIQASPGLFALGLKDPGEIGFLTSIASLGVPAGVFIYSRISKLAVGHLLFIEFTLMGIGFSLMSVATDKVGFLIGCAFNQLGAGMLLPTLLVWAVSQLTFEVRARGTGLWNGAFALGQFLSSIVVTFIALRVGGLLPSFGYLAVCGACAAVLALIGSVILRRKSITSEDV